MRGPGERSEKRGNALEMMERGCGRKGEGGEGWEGCMRGRWREVTMQREKGGGGGGKDRKREGLCLISGPGECLV